MKKTRNRETILSKLSKQFNYRIAYYILFKYKPDLLPRPCKNYKEFVDTYSLEHNVSQSVAEGWLTNPDVQSAIVELKKQFHTIELLDLYDSYRKKSEDDARFWAPFNDVSEQLFKKNTNSNEQASNFLKEKGLVSKQEDADGKE